MAICAGIDGIAQTCKLSLNGPLQLYRSLAG
jgi:hypothetical protein